MSMIITTSWDDGHPLDHRVGELLHRYGLRGTFYVPHHNPEQPTMSVNEVRQLAQAFEIGGHTFSHVVLTNLDARERREEIERGKRYLENALGTDCRSFAFPSGRYERSVLSDVVACGHSFARTISLFRTSPPTLRSRLMHTTVQVFHHTRSTYWKHCLKRGQLKSIAENSFFVRPPSPLDLVERYLAKVEIAGQGILHLWGHSWEIEEHDLWQELEEMCRIVSGRAEFTYLTNSEAWGASAE